MPVLRSLALALVVAAASPARGAEPPVPLQYNLALDVSITAAMGLSVVLLSVFQPGLLPESCRWCTPGPSTPPPATPWSGRVGNGRPTSSPR